MSKLLLIDLKVGENDETVNFDPKHLGKRLRSTCINNNFKIGDVFLLKIDTEALLSTLPVDSVDSDVSVKELTNPRDKQNFPLATEFLLRFIKAAENKKKRQNIKLPILRLTCRDISI